LTAKHQFLMVGYKFFGFPRPVSALNYSFIPMDTRAITDAAKATLAGTLPFPEIVAKLIAAGVEYYHVDYIGLCKAFYDGAGARVVTPIPVEGLPPVALELDVAALRAAILDSQTKGQPWRDFSRRAMAAGVQSYFAFLRGQRVTYLGRTGDQHTEWFPGAGTPDRGVH
jgi:uncharacterized protein YbcV (DUF1398 family)